MPNPLAPPSLGNPPSPRTAVKLIHFLRRTTRKIDLINAIETDDRFSLLLDLVLDEADPVDEFVSEEFFEGSAAKRPCKRDDAKIAAITQELRHKEDMLTARVSSDVLEQQTRFLMSAEPPPEGVVRATVLRRADLFKMAKDLPESATFLPTMNDQSTST